MRVDRGRLRERLLRVIVLKAFSVRFVSADAGERLAADVDGRAIARLHGVADVTKVATWLIR